MNNLIFQSKYQCSFDVRLASIVGVDEAIFLQRVHFWIERKSMRPEENERFYHDGKYWIYNTYAEWHKQFPFWPVIKIRRTVARLEESGLLITGNFNNMRGDKTRWYTVDYNRLRNVLDAYDSEKDVETTAQNEQSTQSSIAQNERSPSARNEQSMRSGIAQNEQSIQSPSARNEQSSTAQNEQSNTIYKYIDTNKDRDSINIKNNNVEINNSTVISKQKENINKDNIDINYTVDNKEKKEKKDIENNNNIGYMKEKKEEKEGGTDSGNYEGMSTEYVTEMVKEACQYRKRTADETNDALKVFDYYLKSYKKYRHENHPYMSRRDIDDIVNYMPWFYVVCPDDGRTEYIDLNYSDYVKMIDNQFESTSGSDCSMDGFMTTENRRKRYYASVRKV